MRGKALHKILLDPTDFLEYFCTREEFDGFVKELYGYNEILVILNYFSLNSKYSQIIADKHNLPYVPKPEIPQLELEKFFTLPLRNSAGVDYLAQRGFLEAWMDRYQVLSFTPREINKILTGRIADYWLFDLEEVEYREWLLSRHGLSSQLQDSPFLAIPSRDLEGRINNIALRVLDPNLSQHVKWMFTHGRQSTFGLHKVDPQKNSFVVEGFFDYVAMDQLGYQAIGLGSAFPSPGHLEALKGLPLTFCLDQDETGESYMERLKDTGYQVARMKQKAKDPWEAFQTYGQIELEA